MSCCNVRSVASYGNACLSARASQALALFRLGCAPLRRTVAFGSNVLTRVCLFCQFYHGVKLIEDEYHVCFDCPLYERLRCSLFHKLIQSEFSFNCIEPHPLNLLASLLSVTNPPHARAVSKFLCDCLAESACISLWRRGWRRWKMHLFRGK